MRSSLLPNCLLVIALLCASAAQAQAPAQASASAPSSTIGYSGGDGSTIKKAIVIAGARNASEGAAAELEWIRIHLPGATVESQGRVTGPPHYDVITVKLATGARMDLHFDITAFFGK